MLQSRLLKTLSIQCLQTPARGGSTALDGLPCHLYFDLEFNRRENLEKDGNEMVDLLITVVFKALRAKYSIEGNLEWVVELDSSTAEKFSRHLVIRIPNTAFKDNSHVGAFVAEICSQITSAKEKDISFKKLFISKESGSAEHQYQLFVDTAVYSRNRCFRLPLSSKAGKSSVLLPTGRFKCKDMSEEDMFMASLICNMDTHCKKLLVWKMELECIKTLHFNTEVYQDYGNRSLNSLDWRQNSPVSDVSNAYFIGKSPFPALDAFIESVASTGNISGRIRSWYWFSEYEMMIYSMSRNRYCERIGREHKSNHVMYVVDFRRATYYQKCHDPDCRGYRSPSRQVPWDVLPYSTYSLNLEAMELQGTSTDKESCHLGDNKQESLPLGEKSPDSCMKDGWWLEAIKFADHVENMQKALEVCYMENADDEDDEEWWTEVEQTAARVELMLSQPNDMKLLC
ncbi:hypothetical protein RJ641_033806 [Dillenia turbinata]|uniref:DNA-directed primase/polymerase protein n=1 Tax=Dillenia turbinata TaxID=194707 RepID=A0AAN8VVY2_9MAGN